MIYIYFFFTRRALCVGQFVFTEEPWFRLSGYINSQNIRIMSAENPHAPHENPLHYVTSLLSVRCNENELWVHCSSQGLGRVGAHFEHLL
jgi:hypothetical protein